MNIPEVKEGCAETFQDTNRAIDNMDLDRPSGRYTRNLVASLAGGAILTVVGAKLVGMDMHSAWEGTKDLFYVLNQS